MPEKIKKLLSKLRPSGKFIVVLLVLILISLWFYWFQWRISEGRKTCLEEVKREKIKRESLFISAANKTYRVCLVRHGIKPEPFILER